MTSMSRLRRLLLLLAIGASLPLAAPSARAEDTATKPAPEAAKPAESLANGASSITETYSDWTVTCGIAEGRKICVSSQTLTDQQGQRQIAIQFAAPKGGKTEAVVLLPFGLALDEGAQLAIDDKAIGERSRFSTCLPAGCVVPLQLSASVIDGLKKGSVLTVTVTSDGNRDVIRFSLSLNGFSGALSRVAELAG